jgi:hypothetical protein
LALLATAILVPVAAGLGEGLAAGLAVAVDVVPPHAAVISAVARTTALIRSFERTQADTKAGYEKRYSGVT